MKREGQLWTVLDKPITKKPAEVMWWVGGVKVIPKGFVAPTPGRILRGRGCAPVVAQEALARLRSGSRPLPTKFIKIVTTSKPQFKDTNEK